MQPKRAPQEWNLRHNNSKVHDVRGIGGGGEVNILMKCVIYIPKTMLVMGKVHPERLNLGKVPTITQQGTTHTLE